MKATSPTYKISNLVIITILILHISCSDANTSTNEDLTHINKVVLTPEQQINLKIKTSYLSEQFLQPILELTGKVASPVDATYEIHLPINGRISGCNLFTGQKVVKGQVLAYIEDLQIIELQQRYLNALNSYNLASIELSRQKELFKDEAGSKKNLQIAENKKNSYYLEFKALEKQLQLLGLNTASIKKGNIASKICLQSPISGFVTGINIRNGAYYTTEHPLMTIQDIDKNYIVLKSFPSNLDVIQSGAKVKLKHIDDENFSKEGSIFLINKSIDENNTIEIHVQPSNKLYWPTGTLVNGQILLPNKRCFAVPKNAVINYEDKEFIWIETGKNIYEMTPIETGIKTQDWMEIKHPELIKRKKIVVSGAYGLYMSLKNNQEE